MPFNKYVGIGKSFGILLVFLLGLFVFLSHGSEYTGTLPIEETNVPSDISDVRHPDEIVINNDVYEKDRKGPVIFAHRNHAKDYSISCWDCHHDYVDGENMWSPWDDTMQCIECHDPYEDNDAIMRLQTAYHINCKNCHKERKIYGSDAHAYRKCNTCHEKE